MAITVAVYAFNFDLSKFSSETSDWGQAGDFFGGLLNPVVSFCALLAILRTLAFQQTEFKETKMLLTNQLMEAKADSNRDRFSWVCDGLKTVSREVYCSGPGGTNAFRNALKAIEDLKGTIYIPLGRKLSPTDCYPIWREGYSPSMLDHFFRAAALAAKFIVAKARDNDEKEEWADYLRIILGPPECKIIAMNLASEPRWKEFKSNVMELRLLRGLRCREGSVIEHALNRLEVDFDLVDDV